MPTLSSHQSSTTTKMILLGDSGAGKTGALASLAAAGYNLRVIDLDNGLDVLANILQDPNSTYGKEALQRVEFETITDTMKNAGGRLIPAKATVWTRTVGLLQNWGGGDPANASAKLGSITTWGTQDILVIDSLTMLSNAAMNFVLSLNARLGQTPHQSDWYAAQQLIESLLQMLYDENVKCNVILISHIAYFGEDNGPMKGLPSGPGKALGPKIGRYFNTTLMARTQGAGTSVKRKILTNSTQIVELKNTAPTKVKAEYDLATGLAEYFADVRAKMERK